MHAHHLKSMTTVACSTERERYVYVNRTTTAAAAVTITIMTVIPKGCFVFGH